MNTPLPHLNCLFLDDERFPKDVTWVKYPDGVNWTHKAKRCERFKTLILRNAYYDVISFDHDLADFYNDASGVRQEHTGFTCLEWLINHWVDAELDKDRFPVCIMHSMNMERRRMMKSYFDQACKAYGFTHHGLSFTEIMG